MVMFHLCRTANPNRVDQADCAICSDGYSASLGFTCNICSNSPGGIALAVIFALVSLVAMISMATYLLSAELERGAAKAFVERLLRRIPVQSVKVVIIAWQIVTQVRLSKNVYRRTVMSGINNNHWYVFLWSSDIVW